MKNLLFFDIDGTLLPEHGRPIPESTVRALRAARAAGNGVFINTGRTRKGVPAAIEALDPDGYVCGCGTAIYLGAERVFYQSLSPARCVEIVKSLRRHKVPSFFESDSHLYFDPLNPARRDPRVRSAHRNFQADDIDLPDPLPADLQFEKFLAFGQPFRRKRLLERVAGNDLQVICREHQMAEVTLAGCTKATGIRWLAEHYALPLENCYAFGDSTNDVSMLEAVPHSVGMGNSAPAIRPLCEYITADILQDGIEKALRHYHLLGRF